MQRVRLWLLAAVFTLCAACADSDSDGPPPEQETIDGVTFTHRSVTAAGFAWHVVEAGRGEPIVFIHGFPESWYSWHHQLVDLAADHRVVALDLKGYGRTDKPVDGYRAELVAEEVAELLEAMDLGRFNLVTHDWGSEIGDWLAGTHPERIRRFVRMEAPVHIIDLENRHQQFRLFQNYDTAMRIMSQAETLVHVVYGYDGRPGNVTVQPIDNAILDRIVHEFSYLGIAQVVPYYFIQTPILDPNYLDQKLPLFANMQLPVLLLQADSDPNQPLFYFDGATDLFPDARLQIIEGSGHFSELEQPAAVSAAIRAFLDASE